MYIFCSKVPQRPTFSRRPSPQGQRERYSGTIDYVLIRQDSKVRRGCRGASLQGSPPRWAPLVVPITSLPQTPGLFPQALAEAADRGDAGCPEASEWVRILAQRSPEHLRRGKDNPVPGGRVPPRWHPPKRANVSGQTGVREAAHCNPH